MNIYNLKPILSLAKEPETPEEFHLWIQQKDVCSFLADEIRDEHIIIYAALPHVFIHGVLLPNACYDSEIDDLLKWNTNPYSSWGLVSSSEKVWVEPPLTGCGSQILEKGEQIVFARSFDGVKSKDHYYEINQRMTHLLNIHFMEERNSWCRLDRFGDLEDIIKITDIKELENNESGVIVSIQKSALEYYASLINVMLVRMFDFTRVKSGSFSGCGTREIMSLMEVIIYLVSWL